MRLKFKIQEFQTRAVKAVTDLFKGQDKYTTTFSVMKEHSLYCLKSEIGVKNTLLIDENTLIKNMNEIQKRSGLPITKNLESNNFCIEMETGTGKTYVYIKTIFELNKLYGFTKFIIVVPSIAIREGVYKSFQTMKDHFRSHYNNVPNHYFIYDSAKLSELKNFATSSTIEIMIINIDAFKKSENIINQVQDKFHDESAMRYIKDTNPIVIIDEPQSVDNTTKAKEAIASLNPLCILRYSATHKEKINTLYRLTPVDAYQMGLVKQICVLSNQVIGGFNRPYIKLLSVSMEKGFKAKIEIDVQGKNGNVSRKSLTVKNCSDLYILSGKRFLYEGYIVEGIDCTPGQECIEFSNTEILKLGKAIGDFDENLIKRIQLRRTIEIHLEKELRFLDKGIKVLSLFFIDEVKKYRTETGDKGIYAQMFEECYEELLLLPKFDKLKKRFTSNVSKIHDGYFSKDKKGNYKDTKGNTEADYNTYNTIMKNKEWLLSFDCPLRFIFSHSALKEGWDNPNIFQVCTLIEQKSTFTCRQKIGRGLRLCVNQNGERIEDKDINILHVVANESFAEFAYKLQKEIEDETGIKFGTLDINSFAGMVYSVKKETIENVSKRDSKIILEFLKNYGYISNIGTPNESLKIAITEKKLDFLIEIKAPKDIIINFLKNAQVITEEKLESITYIKSSVEEKTLTYEESEELIKHFEKKEYITNTGKIKNTMKNAILNGTLDLPQKFEEARKHFEQIIIKSNSEFPIRDSSRDVIVKLNKYKLISPEFIEIWNKIKPKTTYRVNIDTEKLISDSLQDLAKMPKIQSPKVVTKTASYKIEKSGVLHEERMIRTTDITENYTMIPNIIDIVSNKCLIKRSTVNCILQKCERIDDFLINPQLFIESFINIINKNRSKIAVDGIKYIKIQGQEYDVKEIFSREEIPANLDKNAIDVKNSVYDHVIYDSTIEKLFAIALDNDYDVKMFFKIPSKFTIKTPFGNYNPDWAVYIDKDGTKKMYFVLETKGSLDSNDRRVKENLKIQCCEKHFKALNNNIKFKTVQNWHKFKSEI